MLHTHRHAPFLHALTASFLMMGIAVLLSATAPLVLTHASLTGQGVTILEKPAAQDETLTEPSAYHVAAYERQAKQSNTELQLVVGMLLILGGFLGHTLYVVRYKRPQAEYRSGKVVVWFQEWLDRPFF